MHRTTIHRAIVQRAITAVTLALVFGNLSSFAAVQSMVAWPTRFTAVSAKPGPGVGQVTISWKQTGSNTTSYFIETGLTTFSWTSGTHGRNAKQFTVSAKRRSVTLTAAQVTAAGASVASANHLYFRIRAVNRTSAGSQIRNWPNLLSVAVQPLVPTTAGTPVRVASFNVRTAHATQDERQWLQRVPDVADTIIAKRPTVAALQELGPYRADGGTGSVLTGTVRQTVSLLSALKAKGGGRYALVRTTAYVRAGTPQSTQGARILYDTSRLSLVSDCPNSSAKGEFSDSCSISLPLLTGDDEMNRRRAAYAEFSVRATGKHFFVVSAHLDARRSSVVATERTYDLLRARQVRTILDTVRKLNGKSVPIMFAGDLNTWQNNQVGFSAHDTLIAAKFFDTAGAKTQVNSRYSTLNGFNKTMPVSPSGFGARLDAILMKGVVGSSYAENVTKKVDSRRPSDHNLIIADIRLPLP